MPHEFSQGYAVDSRCWTVRLDAWTVQHGAHRAPLGFSQQRGSGL